MPQSARSLWSQLWTEFLVLITRPTIAFQILVVLAGLVTASALGGPVRRHLKRRIGEPGEFAGLVHRLRFHLAEHASVAVVAYLFVRFFGLVVGQLGTRTGLVSSLLGIVGLYAVLKIVLSVALALGDSDGILRYRRSLIVPLIATVVLIRVINVLFGTARFSTTSALNIFENDVSLAALFFVTIGFYLWIVGTQATSRAIQYLYADYTDADEGGTQATLTLVRYLLIIVGLVYVLFRLNFNTTTIAAISGGLSVGVGFAMSTILSNFVSGILLLFERTLSPGDIIDFNGEMSKVERITIRSIRVRTFDNVEKVIPNSDFVTQAFTTYTGEDSEIRLRLPISASYSDDPQKVIATLLEITADYKEIMRDPEPEVRVMNFGDFSIDYHLIVWVTSPMLMGQVPNELNQAIYAAFAKADITIPFPIVDVPQLATSGHLGPDNAERPEPVEIDLTQVGVDP